MNWNSKTKEFTPVVSGRVQQLKKDVMHDRYFHRMTIKDVAKWNDISVSRVYELLR